MTLPRWCVAMLAVVAGTSCADELEGTRVQENVLYFPIGLEVSADGRYAYVANSNFDLQFNAGWLAVIDLETAGGLRRQGPAQATINPEVGFDAFEVDGEGNVIRDDQGNPVVRRDGNNTPIYDQVPVMVDQLRIPSLGGAIARQSNALIYVAHRSDRLISIIDVNGGDASCGDPNAEGDLSVDERRTDCDRQHLFEIEPADAEQASLPDDVLTEFDVGDPYALLVTQPVGQARPFLFTGQLNRARINALAVDLPVGTEVRPLALGDQNNARNEFVTLAGRSEVFAAVGRFNELLVIPRTGNRFLAAIGFTRSGNADRAAVVHVDLDLFLNREENSASIAQIGAEIGGREFSAAVFDPTGRRLYTVARVTNPTFTDNARGAVYRLDTTIERIDQINGQGERDTVERPRFEIEAVTALRGQPSGVVYLERPEGDLLVISDLDQDAIYVLDALSTEMPVLARLDVPGGPFTVRATTVAGQPMLLATLFYDHGLALINASGEPSDFRLNTIIRSDRLGVGERAR